MRFHLWGICLSLHSHAIDLDYLDFDDFGFFSRVFQIATKLHLRSQGINGNAQLWKIFAEFQPDSCTGCKNWKML